MPEVCPFVGTPGLQRSSWINENKNTYHFYYLSQLYQFDAEQIVRRRESGSHYPRCDISLGEVTAAVLAE